MSFKIEVMLTFHPKFSKNVHSLDCPVVLPPQGPKFKQIVYYIIAQISVMHVY